MITQKSVYADDDFVVYGSSGQEISRASASLTPSTNSSGSHGSLKDWDNFAFV